MLTQHFSFPLIALFCIIYQITVRKSEIRKKKKSLSGSTPECLFNRYSHYLYFCFLPRISNGTILALEAQITEYTVTSH